MVVAAGASYYLHANGVGSRVILPAWLLWVGLWVWWKKAKGGLVGPLVSLVVFGLILFGSPRWQLGYELEADCMQTRATEALATYDAENPWLGPGRCGLLAWSQASVHPAALRADVSDPDASRVLTVWFNGAGTTNWDIFGGNALVYSQDGEPRCVPRAVGDLHACEMNGLGDGWFYLRYDSNIN